MLKRITLIGSVLAVAGLSFLSSCKDDEELPVAEIQFETEEQEITESDGTEESYEGRVIEAKLVFDRALAADVVLQFDVDGSATADEDFEIVEEADNVSIDGDKIKILKGATEAAFEILVFEDDELEIDFQAQVGHEEIQLSLESVVSGPATLGNEEEHLIYVYEDDALFSLFWNDDEQDPTTEDDDVDMDIGISVNGGTEQFFKNSTLQNQFEYFYVPAGLGNASFNLRYIYKSGTSDNLQFTVEIANFGGSITKVNGESDGIWVFNATYKQVNISDANKRIAQTLTKSGLNYTDVSEIQVFDTSSRQNVSKPGNKFYLKKGVFSKDLKPLTLK